MELGSWRDHPRGSGLFLPFLGVTEVGDRGLSEFSQVSRHGQWPHPCARPRPSCCSAAQCFPSPRASIQEVVTMAREDTVHPLPPNPPPPLLIYTTMSVCLSVRLLYFCTCILGLDIRPCLCPACHAGLQAPECPLRHTPIWAVGHIAVPGRREQESSGHSRAPGCERWL